MLTDEIMKHADIRPRQMAVCAYDGSIRYQDLDFYVSWADEIIEENSIIGLLLDNSALYIVLLLAMAKKKCKIILLGYDLKYEEIVKCEKEIGPFKIITRLEKSRELIFSNNDWRQTFLKSTFGDIVILTYLKKVESEIQWNKSDFIVKITSGSESLGKYSVRSEQSFLTEISNTIQSVGFSLGDSFLCLPPIWHSFGLVAGALLPLCYGKTLYMIKKFSPDVAISFMRMKKINVLFAVPFMYKLLAKRMNTLMEELPHLEVCFSAGAKLSNEIYRDFTTSFKSLLINDYGSTETGVMCLNTDMENHFESVGKPVKNTILKVFNEHYEEVGIGHDGEICVKSESMSTRYLFPENFNQVQYRDGFYCTKDYGYIGEDGYVYVKGRLDDFLNIAGKKTSIKEIEKELLSLNCISEVAITSKKNKSVGDIVTAHVVTKSCDISAKEIKRLCRSVMSDYKIPRYIKIIDEIPRDKNGKILKKYLD